MSLYKASTQIDTVLGKLENNDSLFLRDQIRRQLNLSMQATNLILGWNQLTFGQITVAGRVCYDVNPSLIFVTRAVLEGKALDFSYLGSLISDVQNVWKATTATENTQTSTWAFVGFRKILIYPADAIGGRLLQVSGVAEPSLFTSESATVNVQSSIMNSVIDHATHSIQVKLTGKPFDDSMAFMEMFQDTIQNSTIWNIKNQPLLSNQFKEERR